MARKQTEHDDTGSGAAERADRINGEVQPFRPPAHQVLQ
jgi:hypothetical protein